MTARLTGQRIALFEARLADELAALVRRSGGVPVCVPAVRERKREAAPAVAALLDELAGQPSPLFVLSTGVGTTALFEEAKALGRAFELKLALTRAETVCRGPKPAIALHREGVAATVRAVPPYTTCELLQTLQQVQVGGRAVVVVHHGERNEPLVEHLSLRGARLHELLLYEWALPEDARPLQAAVHELSHGQLAAAAFTTQIQARHLLQVADSLGQREPLLEALRTRVVVAAVGPTCARVLEEHGVRPQVVPQTPKMAPMLSALVAHLTESAP